MTDHVLLVRAQDLLLDVLPRTARWPKRLRPGLTGRLEGMLVDVVCDVARADALRGRARRAVLDRPTGGSPAPGRYFASPGTWACSPRAPTPIWADKSRRSDVCSGGGSGRSGLFAGGFTTEQEARCRNGPPDFEGLPRDERTRRDRVAAPSPAVRDRRALDPVANRWALRPREMGELRRLEAEGEVADRQDLARGDRDVLVLADGRCR